MSWSKEKLNQAAGERLAKRKSLRHVEKAALAYARWQGLTDEVGLDRAAEKQRLDQTLDQLDKMDVSAWEGLASLADELGEPALKGLMSYSLQRASTQLKQDMQASQPPSPGPAAPKKSLGKKMRS